MDDKQTYWFKRRRYGYGWIPATPQGWLVVAGYLGLVLAGTYMIKDVPEDEFTREVGFFFAMMAVATVLLIRITMARGPKPHWRWGKQPTDNPNEDW